MVSAAVDRFIAQGYSGIAVVDVTEQEERRGYQNEHTVVQLVARRPDRKPVRLVFDEWVDFSPKGGRRDDVTTELITESEYAAVIALHPVIDTAEYRAASEARLKEAADRHDVRASAQAKLNGIRPQCTQCTRAMKARYSDKNKSYFWGCPSFPKCRGARAMNAMAVALARHGAT